MSRVRCYIDGFNLYHAIAALRQNHLKWVDLRKVAATFVDPTRDTLDAVLYFSAYATWYRDSSVRHLAYVRALTASGVTPVMSPPGLGHSGELLRALPEKQRRPRDILPLHLERSLFTAEVVDATGAVVATRPAAYNPP